MSVSISGSSGSAFPTSATSATSVALAKSPDDIRSAPSKSSTEIQAPDATPVSLSGKALLMSRLFAGHLKEPAVSHPSTWLLAVDPMPFLTMDDRKLLGDVYQFASDEGADLAYVDDLACSIARYRLHDNGRRILPQSPGMNFDLEGHEVTYFFTDKNTATATRILQSDAFQTTRLDPAFLRHALDARYSALTYLNFEFVEQVVNKFSTSGTTVEDFDTRFSHFQHNQKNWVKHLSTEVYDLKTRSPLDRESTARKDAEGYESSSPDTISPSEAGSMTLRDVINNYLENNPLPTLFETIARLRR
ncbi:hypothetical protein [Pseudomonas abietaniphila]|uniref:hypothetical protein n=1 Tax=Pseudomonas abietaniphila TaxID=89065 RepID=UPI0007854061|nr:hypothetical protein [Pseudomonas abietaniphila]